MSGYIKENLDKNGKVISFRIAASRGKDQNTNRYKYAFETVKTDSQRVAAKRLRALQSEIDKGVFVTPGKASLREYLESWLKDYCWPNLSPRSAEGYEYVVRHYITPSIGNIALTALKPEQVQRFYTDKLSSGLSNRTVRYCHTTLHKAFQTALKMSLISRNPTEATEPPKVVRREMSIMNENDIHLFLEYSRSTPYYPLFYTLLFTGLRRSEVLALRWQDVDMLLCQISVTRTIHQLRYGDHKGNILFKEPKSAKSRRLVSLTPSSAVVLQEHYKAQTKQRAALNLEPIADDTLVFCNYDGSPYLPDGITHAWRKLADKVGLKGIRLHDSRHSHASLLLKQNVHPAIVAQRLGHSSVQVTMDVYSHILPGLQQSAANNFDNIIIQKDKIQN